MSRGLSNRPFTAAQSSWERSGLLDGLSVDTQPRSGGRSRQRVEGRGPPRAHGRHRKSRRWPGPDWMRALVAEHGVRFSSFSVVGGSVFLLGLGLQAFLVQVCHLGSDPSYLVQGFVSIQVSFLLSYYWTWRDARVPFWRTCGKFNIQKILTSVLNLLVYAGLVAVSVNYLVANVLTTALFTAVNYVFGNRWTFVPPEGK
jgi:putative flippase GtrA